MRALITQMILTGILKGSCKDTGDMSHSWCIEVDIGSYAISTDSMYWQIPRENFVFAVLGVESRALLTSLNLSIFELDLQAPEKNVKSRK